MLAGPIVGWPCGVLVLLQVDCYMQWWGISCKAHVSVVMLWKIWYVGVMSDRVRWCCLNSTVTENWAALVDLATMVWYWYCWSATPTFQPAVSRKSHKFLVPVFLWVMMLHPRVPIGVAS